ncbi:MAG TPA: FAD-binding protein [Falsiroseomonas sp.]|jgi:succinate dehydrogenase/fumarate reductase flavoprotein subunit|nr:FAD-binding protein [Falsiroseomonas sp.]
MLPESGPPLDVVVVGSGAAGRRAAIAAAEAGARVCIVTKGSLLYSGASASANFSYCASFGYFGAGDTAEAYAADVLASGHGLAEPTLALRLAEEAGREADTVEGWGVRWRRDADGRHQRATFGGHRFHRAIHVGLRTGKALMVALGRRAQALGVEVRDHSVALEVLVSDGVAAGLLLLDLRQAALVALSAGAVVLATGGNVAMYALHTNPDELTGDGIALAHAAGATLLDVEFVQSYPTVLLSPPAARGLHYPTGRLLGFGARLLNGKAEEFFGRYESVAIQQARRDALSRAIALEVAAGRGSPRGGAFVDASAVAPGTLRDVHFEGYFQDLDLDVGRDLQEVGPTPHFTLGGVRIDEDGRTDLPGHFAAGEVAGGLHGANRLTGVALPEALVFGAAAGRAAFATARVDRGRAVRAEDGPWSAKVSAALRPHRPGGMHVGEAAAALRRAMQAGAGVLKSAGSLRETLAALDAIAPALSELGSRQPGIRFNWQLARILELWHMLEAARLHAVAALRREESRGAHLRTDHPGTSDPAWHRHQLVQRARVMDATIG